MKYLKTFEEKNIGELYHFTNLVSLSDILQYDELVSYREVSGFDELKNQRGLKDKQNDIYISFTRNKNFYKTHTKNIDVPITCRITIDGNKLSQFYKVYNVNYFAEHESMGSSISQRESEECVVVPYALKDFHKFILKIEIPSFETFKENEINSTYDEQFIYKFINKCDKYKIECGGGDEQDFDSELEFGELNDEDSKQKLYNSLLSTIHYDSILK